MNESEVNASKDFLTVVKVLHFIDGVKFWYFLSNLGFDWRLIHRKSSLKWPALVYLASRLTSIACVVSFLVGLNASSKINCQVWISTSVAFPLLELELSLLLIVVRVVAIWKCSNPIIYLTAMILAMHSGASLHLLTAVRSFWYSDPEYKGCVVRAPHIDLLSMSIATIAAYALLLTAMLAGLLRQRQTRSFGVWNMLCQQGWIWIALAVVAEVPTLVLVLVDIGPSINFLLQVPRVVIASIGTTTMFRMLHNYPGQREAEIPINAVRNRPDSNTSSVPSSLQANHVKISVHTTSAGFSDENTQKEGL